MRGIIICLGEVEKLHAKRDCHPIPALDRPRRVPGWWCRFAQVRGSHIAEQK